MRTRKVNLNHGVSAQLGRVIGWQATGGLAAVTGTDGTEVTPTTEIDFSGGAVTDLGGGLAEVGIHATVGKYDNHSGSDLEYGDVVVIDSSGGITLTDTPQDTRPAGVVMAPIASGDTGTVAFSGDVPFIKVTASVTAGYYCETSDEDGKATEHPTIRTGSFGIFLDDGTEPRAHLFGSSAPPGDSHDHTITTVDIEVLMQDGITAPPTPLENEARDDWLYGTPG